VDKSQTGEYKPKRILKSPSHMNIPDLQKQLTSAQEHLKKVLNSGAGLHDSLAAFEAVTSAQRNLAAAKGEDYAVPHEIDFVPEAAVSEPVLIQTDNTTILTFSAERPMPNGKREDAGHGIIEFDLCSLTKFGYPNDEAMPGHPLYERGLSHYGVFEVCNSTWVKLMTEQNRVAFPRTPHSTERHFIITFHDSTFECIARGLRASLSTKPYAEIFEDIKNRIFKLGA
jgi:hypothetical protein